MRLAFTHDLGRPIGKHAYDNVAESALLMREESGKIAEVWVDARVVLEESPICCMESVQ
jgi:hypothetical protein